MAQATSEEKNSNSKDENTTTPFLEEEILSFIKNSSTWEIEAAGHSYMNPWMSFHFTKGKDSDHVTIHENVLQCISEFLKYDEKDSNKISLFYTYAYASKRKRITKDLTCKIIKRDDFIKNLHFMSTDPNYKKIVNQKPMTFAKAYQNIGTMKVIKKQSKKVYQAIIDNDAKYFDELKKRFNIELTFDEIKDWSS